MRILCYHSNQSGLEPVLVSSSVKSVIPVHVRMTHGKSSIMYFLLCILTAHFGDIPLRRQFCISLNLRYVLFIEDSQVMLLRICTCIY